WTCRTSTAGTCAVGEDQGRHSLSPGTYYWVQTDAPEGYVTPAEQQVATAQITEAEAGTDLQPARVRVADEAAPEEEESDTAAPSHPYGADEEAAPLAEAEEEPDAGDPEGEGAEDPSATEQPAGESGSEAPEGDAPETEAPEGADADGDTPESLTVEGSGGAPLVAPTLAAVPVAQGPVQIGGLQARIANQTSDGSDPCLTYAPEARGDRTAWVTNPDEAQAGHSGPVWVGGFF